MPADYVIDAHRRTVFSRGWGRVTNDELLGNQNVLRADPAFDPSFRQLYDFTGVTEIAVTRDVFPTLRARDPFAAGTRQAIVVGSHAAFGLGRMYELLNDLAEEEFRVFVDLAEARAWLGGLG